MKRKLGRELLLISLPLLIIGATTWLVSGGGRALLPARFDNGPLKLEISPFQQVELSPADVYEGFDWAAKTSVQERGKLDALANLKSVGASGPFGQVQLVYRKGTGWKAAPKVDSKGWATIRNAISDEGLTLKVKLERVPPDAEEVRLRGRVESSLDYVGVLPPGTKLPPQFRSAGKMYSVNLQSKPFDLLIKGPSQPMPNPQVARVPDLEFVAAGWYYQSDVNFGLVRLRTRDGQTRQWNNLRVLSYSLRDKSGKQIVFVDKNGVTRPVDGWSYIFRNNYPDLPENEAIFDFTPFDEPIGGWWSVKEPISLDALVTDGESWPLRVRATLNKQPGDYKTLAQMPASALTN